MHNNIEQKYMGQLCNYWTIFKSVEQICEKNM